MTTSTRKLDAYYREAVAALRHYLREERDTEDLRVVARAFVKAREHFYTRDGSPDWTGRTYAYRAWVREVMGEAGVPGEELSSLQAAIRYHVGTALRETLDADQLHELGLRSDTPRERSVVKRERLSETLNLVTGGAALSGAELVASALAIVEATLRRIEGPVNAEAGAALGRIQVLAEEITSRR